MSDETRVPAYEPMLAAYHRAFAAELQAAVGSVPIAPGQTVLDMACGDGAYSQWLARCVGRRGHVVGVDRSRAYLELARQTSATSLAAHIDFVCAPIEALPFEDGTFDLCWCAHSLYSLPDPVRALRSMLRVVKPGGIVAVLESDTLHHVILPWPAEVELALRNAELRALVDASSTPHKYYVGRHLRSVCRKAGLQAVRIRTLAHDRAAPLGVDERIFLTEYLKGLSGTLAKHLESASRRRLELVADLRSAEFMLNDSDLTVTCIDHLAWGRKP